jgi:hypothetical protein
VAKDFRAGKVLREPKGMVALKVLRVIRAGRESPGLKVQAGMLALKVGRGFKDSKDSEEKPAPARRVGKALKELERLDIKVGKAVKDLDRPEFRVCKDGRDSPGPRAFRDWPGPRV